MLINAVQSFFLPLGGVDQTNEINEVRCWRLWPLASGVIQQLFTVRGAQLCAATASLRELMLTLT